MDRCYRGPILSKLRLLSKPITLSGYEAITRTGERGADFDRVAITYGKTGWDSVGMVRNVRRGIQSMPPKFVVTKGWMIRAGDVLGDNYPHVFARNLIKIQKQKPGLGRIVWAGAKGALKGFVIGEAIGWGGEGLYWFHCNQKCAD
jgi:hypothetical protein